MDMNTTDDTLDPRVERTRRVVRRAALDELGHVGYGAFTIESVAARAGVAKSTIYRHWSNKLALIADAFETFPEQMVPTTETGSPRQRVERLVRHVAEIVLDSTFSACIPALVDGAERDPEVRAFHHRFAAEHRRGLVDVLAEGVATGDFPRRLDPELAALTLLGPIFYRRLMSSEPFAPVRTKQLVDTLLGSSAPYDLRPIGWVESPLVNLDAAPKQGREGSPDAWLIFDPEFGEGIRDLEVGSEIIVLTWLDRARRDVLTTYPRDDPTNAERGVFSTRSPDRPNPVGLHRVQVLSIEQLRVRVRDMEALDGTPIVDVKPVLDRCQER